MKGFSLVEALIATAIFLLIFIAVFSIMTQGQTYWHVAGVHVEVQQNVRIGLMIIDRQLRQSSTAKISIPADDSYYTTVTFNIPKDTDGDGDAIDSNGNIEWSGGISYSLNADKQIVRTDADGASVLANNISSLQFRRLSLNPGIAEVYITGQKATTSGRTSQVSIMSLVKLRN